MEVCRNGARPSRAGSWRSHPLGQTLMVTSGLGWTQGEGGPAVETRAADVVWRPPNRRRRPGAAPTSAMTHIAVQEALDRKSDDGMEPAAQYGAGPDV